MDSNKFINMQPLELLATLQNEVRFEDLSEIDSRESYATAVNKLNASTAYICYFKQMETAARIKKRAAKSAKDTAEYERLMGVEEVFETFKRISEQQYDCIVKMFTAKRLEITEYERQGKMI